MRGKGQGRRGGVGLEVLGGICEIATEQRWKFAEHAVAHAYEALNVLIEIMRSGQSESARVAAADKILDRALGKAPLHIDVTALRHTEIVYRSAEEIRNALLGRGLPPALLDLRPAAAKDDDDDIVD